MSARDFLQFPRKILTSLIAHTDRVDNPHIVTKQQIGLSNVDNTSDADKPLSTASTAALAGKEPTITLGTSLQYLRGDKTLQDFATTTRGVILTGLSLATSTVISATDTVLSALGKLQAQVSIKAPIDQAALTTRAKITGTATTWTTSALGDSGNTAPFEVVDSTNIGRKGAMGYDSTANEFVIQSMEAGVTTRDTAVNPSGGNIKIGRRGVTPTTVFGVPYIPNCSGPPTGAPNVVSGMSPIVFDSTNNRIYVYINSAWRFSALT